MSTGDGLQNHVYLNLLCLPVTKKKNVLKFHVLNALGFKKGSPIDDLYWEPREYIIRIVGRV
jgi:hypothetical protein